MDREGTGRVEMVGVKDKHQITALFCCTLQGDFLPMQLIYKGKTSRCHPKFKFPLGWHITHAPKYWSTEETVAQYIHNTVWHKILTGENIDEFDKFPAIRQYFPYQNFPFS